MGADRRAAWRSPIVAGHARALADEEALGSNLNELQTRLWGVADQLRANSGLRSSEYSTPVLGLIFLRYADLC